LSSSSISNEIFRQWQLPWYFISFPLEGPGGFRTGVPLYGWKLSLALPSE
jgi:hypothetical protein